GAVAEVEDHGDGLVSRQLPAVGEDLPGGFQGDEGPPAEDLFLPPQGDEVPVPVVEGVGVPLLGGQIDLLAVVVDPKPGTASGEARAFAALPLEGGAGVVP